MEVGHISNGQRATGTRGTRGTKGTKGEKGQVKRSKVQSKSKSTEPDKQDKESLRTRLLVTNPPRPNSKRDGRCKGGCRRSKKFMFTIENTVKNGTLSQSGRECHENGLEMIDTGAFVNVCPKWFGGSALEQADGAIRLGGAVRRTLQDCGKRQIWLRIGNRLKRYEFHVVDMTKPIPSVNCKCEHGIETHLAEDLVLKHGERQEPLTKIRGVYFSQRTDRS